MSNQILIPNAKSEDMKYEPINICGSGLPRPRLAKRGGLPAIIEPGKVLSQSMSQPLAEKKKEVL